MIIKQAANPSDFRSYDTKRLREEFLIENVFPQSGISMTYSHVDRIIIGGASPGENTINLSTGKELGVGYFLERREIGIINVGEKGTVTVDGKKYELSKHDGLYIGMGIKDVLFESKKKEEPAKFYFNSAPAHKNYPVKKIEISKAEPLKLGSLIESNSRTIYKYIHPDGVKSCQLIMGMTLLEEGSVWNTMPCHTHGRRMEVYFYFDLSDNGRVFHYMGKPDETRHIIIGNEQASISPSWSIHAGCGTCSYSFIWGMAGENQTFNDMDAVDIKNMK